MVSGDGMMILNDAAYLSENWRTFQAACILFTTLFLLIAVLVNGKKIAIASAFIAVAIAATGLCVTFKPSHYQTQYQVIFDDSISANEVYEKYEVIKVDGKIWTIREKQNVKD